MLTADECGQFDAANTNRFPEAGNTHAERQRVLRRVDATSAAKPRVLTRPRLRHDHNVLKLQPIGRPELNHSLRSCTRRDEIDNFLV
jgi:hypothetical protein